MVKIKIGVLHAGGKGTRAYPSTAIIPKVMLKVNNKPLLERNIEIMRDKLKIKTIYVVVGYLSRYITRYFGDGSRFGVKIKYIKDRDMKGLAHATYLLREHIKEPFVMILGDELYKDSNHEDILKVIKGKNKFIAFCGVNKTNNVEKIKNNYAVELKEEKIRRLIEKPKIIPNNLLGCGTYVLSPAIFKFIYRLQRIKRTRRVDWTSVLDMVVKKTGEIYPFYLKGNYVNVNTIDDINSVNCMLRRRKFEEHKISLIIPTKNESGSIASVVSNFKDHKMLKEIILVDASTDNTIEIAKRVGKGKVRIVKNFNLKYGSAIKHGMDIAKGDILVLTEGDYTFRSQDLPKILEYLKDCDMAIGTRTTKQMIQQGTNMKNFLRIGNIVLGKLMQSLWANQQTRLSDAGCTYRGIWKESYMKIRKNLKCEGPGFAPEMIIEVMKAQLRLIEIPVGYYQRLGGRSEHSIGTKIIKTGFSMLNIIFGKKLGWK
jgi:UDP-N-acetylglucosamine diphosphorylase / glucose-1-phosphate thymidylyltransferase / UDP-N-acetylgalactosamine diphosphorylase / glucosamine-1-phosphate N-acetyltransferase / galactosamine-1-phosphate N-acetyltransferase